MGEFFKKYNMKFLYCTDLHGNKKHYENVFKYAIANNINLIHFGADILPKDLDLMNSQSRFIKGYLKKYFEKCNKNGIKIITSFGNDDLYVLKTIFKEYGELLDENKYIYDKYIFKSYPFVLDYPFGLKTACKLDYLGWKCSEPYIHYPCDVTKWGYYNIKDIEKYFAYKTTIEEDLKQIKVNKKTIISIHQPPYELKLDVCSNGKKVGSKSVYKWIKKNQPLLVLCGHIHESYSITNIWKTNINKTIIIQPGQGVKTNMVDIEIIENNISAKLIQK